MVQGEAPKTLQDAASRAKDPGTDSKFGERGALQAGEMACDELRCGTSSEIRDAEDVPEDAACTGGSGRNKTQDPENQREGCTCNVYVVALPLPAAFAAQDPRVSAVSCGDL